MTTTQNTLNFLAELAQNNNKDWFNANKVWYNDVRSEFESLVARLIDGISKFDEDLKHTTVKECVFRIHRDTRFSHDKTPYKTHFGAYIASNGGRKSPRAGYYLHLEPKASFVASGVWMPEPNVLKALRKSVYDNIDELKEIITKDEFSQYYKTFYSEDALKKIPAGFPKDFPDADLLKLKHYIVECNLSEDLLMSDDFENRMLKIFKAGHPFNHFLNHTIDELIKSEPKINSQDFQF